MTLTSSEFKKEKKYLVCPYCNKKFEILSKHIRMCENRPSDKPRDIVDKF